MTPSQPCWTAAGRRRSTASIPCETERRSSANSWRRPTDKDQYFSTNGANSYSEVTNLFCRLPLPSFRDKARDFLSWDPDADIGTDASHDDSFHQLFTDTPKNTRRCIRCIALHVKQPRLALMAFKGCKDEMVRRKGSPPAGARLTRKDNSPWISSMCRWFHSRCRQYTDLAVQEY
jgi:hypothetical protein